MPSHPQTVKLYAEANSFIKQYHLKPLPKIKEAYHKFSYKLKAISKLPPWQLNEILNYTKEKLNIL